VKASISEVSISYLPIAKLKPNPHNSRTHSKHQIRQIADSIKAFGFTNPVLIDRNNTVIAGHGRLAAAKLLGISQVPTILIRICEVLKISMSARKDILVVPCFDRIAICETRHYLKNTVGGSGPAFCFRNGKNGGDRTLPNFHYRKMENVLSVPGLPRFPPEAEYLKQLAR
jgi:hypothetical protein